jgi:octopine/nopaline transport system substrate-binding protein
MKPGLFLLSLLLVIVTATGASAESSRIVRIAAGHHQLASETKPAGDLAGFEVDLATALCTRAGLICKLLPDGDDAELIPALLGGKYDAIVAGLSVTPDRQRIVNFTQPYASISYGFAVSESTQAPALTRDAMPLSLSANPQDSSAAIRLLRTQLAGRTIGARAGTAGLLFVKQHFGDVATIRDYADTAQQYDDLLAGRIDCVMDTTIGFKAIAAQAGYQHLAMADPASERATYLGSASLWV